MTVVRIGDHEFDHASYDAKADVLYLRAGAPREAADTVGTPEGHAVRFDGEGEVRRPHAGARASSA
jgi:hypothetical protein